MNFCLTISARKSFLTDLVIRTNEDLKILATWTRSRYSVGTLVYSGTRGTLALWHSRKLRNSGTQVTGALKGLSNSRHLDS